MILLVLFVVVEARVEHPLLPLHVATERNRAAAFLAALPMTVMLVVTAGVVAKFLPKLGAKLPTVVGPVFIAVAMLVLSGISAQGNYVTDVLPALLALGIGLRMTFVPMQNLALFGIHHNDPGVASALVNASQQIGGSFGTSLFSTIAAAVTVAASGTLLKTVTAGYSSAFLWAAFLAILIAPIALPLIRLDRRAFSGAAFED